MGRVGTALVLAMVAAGSAAVTSRLHRPEPAAGRSATGETARADEWGALSESDQAAWLARYRAIAQRPDAEEIWHRARRFAGLPAAERQRLATLYAAMRQVLDGLPSSRQAALLGLPEAARAEAVFRILATELPERLKQLRQQLGQKP